MARTVFFVWPIAASVVCTLKLARDLRNRGHEIIYLGTPECRRFALAHDLPFIPLYESAFPERDSYIQGQARLFGAELRAERSRAIELVEALLDERSGSVGKAARSAENKICASAAG
ncbi:hypothetical protein IY145_08625 [Methylosinus sp. H3A]|uniref:hypothetical protein n=1 Tax=Methylosinus sp. H3A TaxID=2785786 RepID=UPI0018C34A90|nr:hypothetical protein [Methylosinus sp. H3A]MBG0809442.1 hypothetical protein [Methylosinus sp. H3A]